MTTEKYEGNEGNQEPKIRSRIFFKENYNEPEPVIRDRLAKKVLHN